MIIKQTINGEEVDVEVFSQEELDTKLQETQKEFEAKIAEKDGNLTKLADEKAELEKKIGGVKEDHPNFKALKEALKVKDDEIKKISTDLENDKKLRIEESFNSKIKIATKGNEEMEKKVKLHLSSTLSGMPESTDVERQVKLEAAVKLSSDYIGGEPNIFDGGISAGGAGYVPPEGQGGVEFTAREKALGSKMGISAEDYKKYGSRLNKK